jgi:hypothetical protein
MISTGAQPAPVNAKQLNNIRQSRSTFRALLSTHGVSVVIGLSDHSQRAKSAIQDLRGSDRIIEDNRLAILGHYQTVLDHLSREAISSERKEIGYGEFCYHQWAQGSLHRRR